MAEATGTSLTPLHISATPAEVGSALVERLRVESQSAIKQRGTFHIALSGGSLPALLGAALFPHDDAACAAGRSSQPAIPLDELRHWHWWWADERCVKHEDEDSNYRLAQEHIFRHMKDAIQPANIHAIDAELVNDPKAAASSYESHLRSVLPSGEMDVALLGMGPDGHCCSLFPQHALLNYTEVDTDPWIAHILDSPKPPPTRITMTLALLKKARLSLFVVTGGNKAAVTSDVIRQRNRATDDEKSQGLLPSARVQSQRVEFMIDAAAAEKIPQQDRQSQHKL